MQRFVDNQLVYYTNEETLWVGVVQKNGSMVAVNTINEKKTFQKVDPSKCVLIRKITEADRTFWSAHSKGTNPS
jgi:hypothetical protein